MRAVELVARVAGYSHWSDRSVIILLDLQDLLNVLTDGVEVARELSRLSCHADCADKGLSLCVCARASAGV